MVAIQYLPVIIGLSETFQHFNDSHLLPQHFGNLLKAPRPPSPRPPLSTEALYYSTIYHNSCDLGTAQTPLVGWPLAKLNPTVCSLACRWRLRSVLQADQESFSIESGPHP